VFEMLRRRSWLVPTLIVGGALAFARYRWRDFSRLGENLHRYSAPNVAIYDTFAAAVLDGFFTSVAQALGDLLPNAQVLEVGSGPGRLAVKLAELAAAIRVTGVDITPEMVERANALAARSGVADRVDFRVGDVASLPFPAASFDVVVSTFSLHHWQNPAAGLAETYRVLRPGGVARIYDLVDWIRRFEQRGAGIVALARTSPFEAGGSWTHCIRTRLGPIPLVYLAELRCGQLSATSGGER
jgi:SAM-dependent methyltransferase